MEDNIILKKIRKKKKERVGFYLPEDLVENLRMLSDRFEVSSSAIVQLFIENELKKYNLVEEVNEEEED